MKAGESVWRPLEGTAKRKRRLQFGNPAHERHTLKSALSTHSDKTEDIFFFSYFFVFFVHSNSALCLCGNGNGYVSWGFFSIFFFLSKCRANFIWSFKRFEPE